jgi:hypothetical protein
VVVDAISVVAQGRRLSPTPAVTSVVTSPGTPTVSLLQGRHVAKIAIALLLRGRERKGEPLELLNDAEVRPDSTTPSTMDDVAALLCDFQTMAPLPTPAAVDGVRRFAALHVWMCGPRGEAGVTELIARIRKAPHSAKKELARDGAARWTAKYFSLAEELTTASVSFEIWQLALDGDWASAVCLNPVQAAILLAKGIRPVGDRTKTLAVALALLSRLGVITAAARYVGLDTGKWGPAVEPASGFTKAARELAVLALLSVCDDELYADPTRRLSGGAAALFIKLSDSVPCIRLAGSALSLVQSDGKLAVRLGVLATEHVFRPTLITMDLELPQTLALARDLLADHVLEPFSRAIREGARMVINFVDNKAIGWRMADDRARARFQVGSKKGPVLHAHSDRPDVFGYRVYDFHSKPWDRAEGHDVAHVIGDAEFAHDTLEAILCAAEELGTNLWVKDHPNSHRRKTAWERRQVIHDGTTTAEARATLAALVSDAALRKEDVPLELAGERRISEPGLEKCKYLVWLLKVSKLDHRKHGDDVQLRSRTVCALLGTVELYSKPSPGQAKDGRLTELYTGTYHPSGDDRATVRNAFVVRGAPVPGWRSNTWRVGRDRLFSTADSVVTLSRD